MRKVLAYVLRFSRNIMKTRSTEPPLPQTEPLSRSLTVRDIREAENYLIRLIQQQLPPNLPKKIRPYKDEEGVVRTATRLTHFDTEDFKSPIILPRNHQLVEALIMWEHAENSPHLWTDMLFAKLREHYFILQGRRTVQRAIKNCDRCKRFTARPLKVPEGNMPKERTELTYPWKTIGVDAAGPLIMRHRPKEAPVKRWLIFFTCAVFRAVHIEIVDELSTTAFIRALRSFVCARTRPSLIYCDNGLNFVGAHNAFMQVDWTKVQEYGACRQIEWRFNPANAPWWTGFVERMIGIVKSLLRRVLGNKAIHPHELKTLVEEVTDAVNSRPLTYISEDPQDPLPLTPNHFIKWKVGPIALPEADALDATHLRAAYRKLQNLREVLRNGFRLHYLGSLLHNRRPPGLNVLKPGEVVLVHHDNWKRELWPLGVIVSPISGPNDVPRAYVVRMKGGDVTRPAQRLYPLEFSEDDAEQVREAKTNPIPTPDVDPASLPDPDME